MSEVRNLVVSRGGRLWMIKEAVSLQAADNAIASARVTGSIGMTTKVTDVDKVTRTIADVHQINSDGTLRQAYTAGY